MCIEPGREEPLVSPIEFVDNEEYPERGIMIFTECMAEAIRKLSNLDYKPRYSNNIYRVRYDGYKLSLLFPCYGAPASTVAFELAIANGLRKIIIVGEAGAIDPRVKITDYVLPTWGVREEGVSYHYMPRKYIPKIENRLHKMLLDNLGNEGYRVYTGGVWSIDAIFRETRDKVKKYSGKGVLCVDMEATALMTVADYRNVEAVILLVISDELYHGKWISGWDKEKLKDAEYKAVKTALDTLIKY